MQKISEKFKFPRLFIGWWMVVATAITTGIAGGFIQQGGSALFKPIASELKLNRASTSLATGIGTLQIGLVFPLAGWLSDKFGPKWVNVIGAIILCTGLVLMNYIDSAWAYYMVWGLIVMGGNTLGYSVAIDTMLTNWFVRKRGRAFSIRFALVGILGVILLPIISLLIETQGWRTTCLIWSGLVFTGIPVALYFIRQRRPEYYGLLPDGAGAESSLEEYNNNMIAKGIEYASDFQEEEFTLKQAMKTQAYWILTVAWVLRGMVLAGTQIHIIPMLTDTGIDPVAAGGLMAMMIFFTIPSSFIGGIIADRIGKERTKYLLSGILSLFALGIGALLLPQDFTSRVYFFLVLYGLGSGAYTPLDIIARSRYFGRKAYGAIQGSSVLFSAPLSFAAPIYTGWVYDVTGSYTNAYIVYAIMACVAVVMTGLIRAPKLPVSVAIHSIKSKEL
jgi:MFS family permease